MTATKTKTGGEANTALAGELRMIPVDLIDPDPNNPPGRGEPDDVKELAESMREFGQLNAINVVATADGRYRIKGGGHRRLGAHRLLGHAEAECVVRTVLLADEAGIAGIIENLQRKDVDPVDEARGFQRLVAEGWSQERISESVGCAQSHVSKRLALLKLPDKILAKVGAPKAGIAIADALELAKVADQPAVFKRTLELASLPGVGKGRYETASAVTEAKKQVDDEEKRVAKVRDLVAAGVKVLDEPHKTFGYNVHNHEVRKGAYYGVDLDPGKHGKEPCHAVAVEPGGKVVVYCMEPKRHRKPKTKDAAEEARKKAHRERVALTKEAAAARREFVTAMLKRRLSRDTVLTVLSRALVDRPPYHDYRSAAAELLGVNVNDGHVNVSPLERYAEQHGSYETAALAVALGCMGARVADVNDGPHYDPDAKVFYLDFLVAQGYPITEFEQTYLDAARKHIADAANRRNRDAERDAARRATLRHCRSCGVDEEEARGCVPPIEWINTIDGSLVDVCDQCRPACAGQLHDADTGHLWDSSTCLYRDEPTPIDGLTVVTPDVEEAAG